MIEPIPMNEEPYANKAEPSSPSAMAAAEAAEAETKMSRKDKRKALKKEKRKQKRKELAEKARHEEEARLNDPEQQRLIEVEEAREKERLERERREFEERERLFLEQLAQRKLQEEEEAERRRAREEEEEAKFKQKQLGHESEVDEENDWEYIEEGPPEIIWQGNEIIVKKNKVKVKKKDADQQAAPEDPNRPTSNPLPPQSEAFAEHRNASVVSAQQLLDDVAQQTPNFGTEQDKAHCPFHLKTGACRFGMRCSRVHFYPDKSCTLLVKNMYSGPGLTWEQDEGLEHTDEEVERCYEEFYEDVHTEFLKFGEIINFKVCRNSSVHLRGNVYVHYKDLDSAVLAYHSINGRYFAGKQVTCEFVNVMRWKVAICGEYMKSKLKTCSRGTTCNFIHCFRNPGGDYEWADWDKPPPRYWIKKMAALFGYSDEYSYAKQVDQESSMHLKDACKISLASSEGYRSRRSQSKEMESSYRCSRSHQEEPDVRRDAGRRKHSSENRKHKDFHHEKRCEEGRSPRDYRHGNGRFCDNGSDRDWSDRDTDYYRHHGIKKRRSRTPKLKTERDWSDRDSDDDRHHDGCRRRSRTLEVKCERECSDRDSDGDRRHDGSRRRSRIPRVKSERDWSAREGEDDRHHDDCRRRSRTLRVKSEREWSDTDSDDDRPYDSSRRRSRTLSVKSEYWDHQGENEGRDQDTNLPADSSNQERGRHSEHSRKRSRHQEEVSGNLDNCKDSKDEARHMRSSREWSSKDRDREMHLSGKRRTLRHHDELCISQDDHWDGRSKSHDSDYNGVRPGEVSDSCYTNESFSHSNLASEVSDDEETSNGKDTRRAYKHAKSRQHKKHNYCRGRDDSSGQDSEVDKHSEHSRPEKRGRRNSSRHESGRDSEESNLHRYQEGGNLLDTKWLCNENVAMSDRWEPDKVVTGKHRKDRRKSDKVVTGKHKKDRRRSDDNT